MSENKMPENGPVSEQQLQNSELQALLNFQTEIFNSLPAHLVVIDDEYNILNYNQSVANMAQGKSVVGKNLFVSLDFYQSEALNKVLTDFINSNRTVIHVTLDHPHKMGEKYIHSISRLKDIAGLKAFLLHSTLYDGKEGDQLNDFIQDKFTSLGAFAGKIAHDINNPLSVILTRIDFLQSMDLENAIEEGDVEIVEEIGIIQRQAQRIYDILDKIGALQMHAKETPVECDVTEIVTRAVTIAEFQRPFKTVHAVKELTEGLPRMVCNEIKLERAINEMLRNAFEAVGEQGDVSIKLTFEEPEYRLEIKDSGLGIPPENIGKVFDPFFTTKQGVKGAGLGLTIAYAAALAHNGRIEINSVPKSGTTMTLILRRNSVNE